MSKEHEDKFVEGGWPVPRSEPVEFPSNLSPSDVPAPSSDHEAATTLRKSLARGEELLWAGRPASNYVFKREGGAIWILLPVGLMLTVAGGIGLEDNTRILSALYYAVIGMLNNNTGQVAQDIHVRISFISTILLFFFVLGLFVLAYGFLIRGVLKGREYYGITERRLIITYGTLFRSIRSFDLADIVAVEAVVKHGGKGTVAFLKKAPQQGMRTKETPQALNWYGTGSLFKVTPGNVGSIDTSFDAAPKFVFIDNAEQLHAFARGIWEAARRSVPEYLRNADPVL